MKERRRTGGLSLVELLVVIAIIAVTAAIAVPTFLRSGFLYRSDIKGTAREVHSLLTAARIYAAANNVDTAIAYTMTFDADPEGGPPRRIIDGIVMIRQMTIDEVERTNDDWVDAGNPKPIESRETAFTPVQNRQGRFRRFEGDTCISIDPSASIYSDLHGMTKIRIYDGDGTPISPPDQSHFPDTAGKPGWYDFPAHVFNPTGFMDTTREARIVMPIEYVNRGTGEREQEAAPVSIVLRPTLGRITMEG